MPWQDLFKDPASNQLSMSRGCYGALILGVLFVTVLMVIHDKWKEVGDLIKFALMTTAGVYGANSVAGAVARRGEPVALPNPWQTKPDDQNKPVG